MLRLAAVIFSLILRLFTKPKASPESVEAAKAVRVQAAMTQAAVDAPETQAEVVDALKNGRF